MLHFQKLAQYQRSIESPSRTASVEAPRQPAAGALRVAVARGMICNRAGSLKTLSVRFRRSAEFSLVWLGA
jgi:hypothetical protein